VGGNDHTTAGDRWIDGWPHNGRLAWSGAQYAAYFGQSGNFGAQGNHQGDTLRYVTSTGTPSVGWDWGCSHSLDVRLVHNGTRWAPICLSDCYPGKAFWINHSERNLHDEPSGNCGGYSSASLGGLVPWSGGFYLVFSSAETRASNDLALVWIANGASTPVAAPTWLTSTDSVSERSPRLARLGDRLLLGWVEGSTRKIAVIDTSGTIIEPAITLSQSFGAGDDFVTFDNGDVGWAHAWTDLTRLKVVRVQQCQ
jgi:hypothetical protein